MCIKSMLSMFSYFKPQVLDKDGMVREINWKEFTLSKSSDVYEENYSYTVAKGDNNSEVYLYYQTIAESGNSLDSGIRLKEKTVKEIHSMRLMDLPDETPLKQDILEEETFMLDGTYLQFSIIDEYGNIYKKNITSEQIERLKEILMPYV